MNWFGAAWPRSMIPVKSSLTPKRFTLGRESAREPWYRRVMHNSVGHVSKTGFFSPQDKTRFRLLSLRVSQREALDSTDLVRPIIRDALRNSVGQAKGGVMT